MRLGALALAVIGLAGFTAFMALCGRKHANGPKWAPDPPSAPA